MTHQTANDSNSSQQPQYVRVRITLDNVFLGHLHETAAAHRGRVENISGSEFGPWKAGMWLVILPESEFEAFETELAEATDPYFARVERE